MFPEVFGQTYTKKSMYSLSEIPMSPIPFPFLSPLSKEGQRLRAPSREQPGGPLGRGGTLTELLGALASGPRLGHGDLPWHGPERSKGQPLASLQPIFGPRWPLGEENPSLLPRVCGQGHLPQVRLVSRSSQGPS